MNMRFSATRGKKMNMRRDIAQFRSGWPGRGWGDISCPMMASNGGITLAHLQLRMLRILFNNRKGRYVFTERFPSL